MGDIHWLKEMPMGRVLIDADTMVVPQDVFDAIGDYTRSTPTAPSGYRIYKRHTNWYRIDEEPVWFVYITLPELNIGTMKGKKGEWMSHVPRRLLVA